MPVLSRRDFIRGAAATGAALSLPSTARAVAPADRKLITITAFGGWENTRFISPMLDSSTVYNQPGAVLRDGRGMTYVDHAARPNGRAFFDAYGDRVAVLDGMLVRSVNHRVCNRLVRTGVTKVGSPDWQTILGAAVKDRHALPSVVLDGPTSPGPLERYSSVVGEVDQLQALLDGSVFTMGEDVTTPPTALITDAVERALATRLSERRAGAADDAQRMVDAYEDALARVQRLQTDAELVQFAGARPVDQAVTAVSMLAHGVARCVSIQAGGFDTHINIDAQDGFLENMFEQLNVLVSELERTPGTSAPTLWDETVIMVVSEMGRAPYVNKGHGKDHWPYTSAMLLGSGVRGGVRVGTHDSFLNGQRVNTRTGALDDAGTVLTPQELGATVLVLGGVDPAEHIPGVSAVEAVLA